MAHFAELDADNKVIRVVRTDNNKIREGYDWLIATFGGTWVQTSFNTFAGEHLLGGTPFRKNYAAPGFTYDAERDAFISPKPHDSWVLDENTCRWESPVPYPEDGKLYYWDEASVGWVEEVAE